MRHSLYKLYILAVMVLVSCTSNTQLPRATESEKAAFVEYGNRVFDDVWGFGCDELHSLMVVRDGRVLYERWSTGHLPEELHILWSASKTFTATAVGFAVQDGLLNLDDRVVSYLTDEELHANHDSKLDEMTIRHLLTMSSGLQPSNCNSRIRSGENFDAVAATLAQPFIYSPGKQFSYDSMDTYLLSVIISRVTGKKVADYLNEKLFTYLGIDDYAWDVSLQGYNTGGWGLYLSTESLAKMGQFMLQRGEWTGRELLDKDWCEQAMSPQIMQYAGRNVTPEQIAAYRANDDWNQGYGFQMWCCRHGAYRLDGAWGQFVIIIPDKNAVVVATSHSGSPRRLLNSIWNNIYPQL